MSSASIVGSMSPQYFRVTTQLKVIAKMARKGCFLCGSKLKSDRYLFQNPHFNTGNFTLCHGTLYP